MSPLRIGKVWFRYDTLIVSAALFFSGLIGSVVISHQLSASARAAAENSEATRRVLMDILAAMNDNREFMHDMRDIAVKQRELEGKLADLYQQIEARHRK